MGKFYSPIIAHERRIAHKNRIAKTTLEIEDAQKEKTVSKMVEHLHYSCSSQEALDLLEAIIAGQVPGLYYKPRNEGNDA